MTTIKILTDALHSKTVVRFVSRYEEGRIEGYVLDVGPQFFLMAIVDDRISFDGFQCMRFSDVTRLEVPASNSDFVVAALIKRGESIESKPQIDLTSAATIRRRFPRRRSRPRNCRLSRGWQTMCRVASAAAVAAGATGRQAAGAVQLSAGLTQGLRPLAESIERKIQPDGSLADDASPELNRFAASRSASSA
jgi:hypothetical protein